MTRVVRDARVGANHAEHLGVFLPCGERTSRELVIVRDPGAVDARSSVAGELHEDASGVRDAARRRNVLRGRGHGGVAVALQIRFGGGAGEEGHRREAGEADHEGREACAGERMICGHGEDPFLENACCVGERREEAGRGGGRPSRDVEQARGVSADVHACADDGVVARELFVGAEQAMPRAAERSEKVGEEREDAGEPGVAVTMVRQLVAECEEPLVAVRERVDVEHDPRSTMQPGGEG